MIDRITFQQQFAHETEIKRKELHNLYPYFLCCEFKISQLSLKIKNTLNS